jgi:hypothetical protein
MSIGVAFSENVTAGISISIAIACEEFPHEIGKNKYIILIYETFMEGVGGTQYLKVYPRCNLHTGYSRELDHGRIRGFLNKIILFLRFLNTKPILHRKTIQSKLTIDFFYFFFL